LGGGIVEWELIFKAGDQIPVISPSQSLSLIVPEHKELAKLQLGLDVTSSKNSSETDDFISSIQSRIEEFLLLLMPILDILRQ
jgi:muramoyltetrapeptide carboxypeptidase LdcA involved in peptidoglycan recycling